MIKLKKTTKRLNLINEIIKKMKEHDIFSESVSRKTNTENMIQKSVFSMLDKRLPEIISKNYGITERNARKQIKYNFIFESKTIKPVPSFNFFATNHRPDAILELRDIRIAFEIKKGEKGNSIRSGIGQSIVYSTQYDFVLYFFVDTTPGCDINSSKHGDKEKELIKYLWDNYNIRFFVV
ncbi:MAG: hypothetical protein JW794_04175 [Candidatus Cloacimonetes bacterium]|nr:hypothetical protein [Candidatus Cloacimonadota bacterium]